MSLDWASLVLLCDGYVDGDAEFKLHLNPKISPYKVAFTAKAEGEASEVRKDLDDLVLYLNNMLRTSGINTILTNKLEVESKFQVPFVVNVDPTSLKNGVIRVKSQFTALNESVHITGLVNHISSRCL